MRQFQQRQFAQRQFTIRQFRTKTVAIAGGGAFIDLSEWSYFAKKKRDPRRSDEELLLLALLEIDEDY